jgi:ATP-dependent protease ClpP protease subunit
MDWRRSNKRRKADPDRHRVEGDEDDNPAVVPPFMLPRFETNSRIYSHMNHVYFNDDITEDTAFHLNRELLSVKARLTMLAGAYGSLVGTVPIYLHMTTNGGGIHAAFSVVDCIQSLGVPVYTVVDGFVASAGTLITISASRRLIMPNAYMLIHELRSGVWGKMTSIEEEFQNLKKVMDHINTFYQAHTQISKRSLDSLLKKDVIWNAEECMSKGIVDEIYTAT